MKYYRLTYPANPNTYTIVTIEGRYSNIMLKPLLDIQIEPYAITHRKGNYIMQLTRRANLHRATDLTMYEIFALKEVECNSK